MKVSCSTICYHDLRLEDVLERIQAADFRHVELMAVPGECHFNARTADRVKLRRLLAKHNLAAAAIHTGSLATGEIQTRSVSYAKAAAEVSAYLGAPVVVATAPKRGESTTKEFLATLLELVGVLEGAGVRLAVQNLAGSLIERPEDYKAVFAHASQALVGMALDAGHFHAVGIAAADVARAFGDRVAHVHVSDRIGEHPVPVGHGEVDFQSLVDALAEADYSGFLSVEVAGVDPSTMDRYGKEALEFIGRLLPGA